MVERICEKLCGAWQAFRVTDGATISRAHTHAEAEKDTLGGERQAGRCSLVRTASFFFCPHTHTHDCEVVIHTLQFSCHKLSKKRVSQA